MPEPLGQVSNLIVHHSASPRDTTTVEDIRSWHKSRGFEDIGYHWVIEADGAIKQGRLPTIKGAHAKGRNWDSWGVCVVGDNTSASEAWSPAQEDSLISLIRAVRVILPRVRVLGHREAGTTPTECPGLDFQVWLANHGG